jgi:hypothetical protein
MITGAYPCELEKELGKGGTLARGDSIPPQKGDEEDMATPQGEPVTPRRKGAKNDGTALQGTAGKIHPLPFPPLIKTILFPSGINDNLSGRLLDPFDNNPGGIGDVPS